MKPRLAVILSCVGSLLGAGCATKGYVRTKTEPIQTKVDQVADQTNKQGATLDTTVKQVQQDETELSATKETAKSADSRASDALTKADAAGQKADQNSRDVGAVRERLSNLDNYKVASQAVVLFGLNKDTLTPEGKQQLDNLAAGLSSLKRYLVAVEGFTDKTGAADYNLALSRRRADRVVNYLVVQHNVPVYRIQLVGLGKEKPADEGRNRAARAKNRRVEVTVYSADAAETAEHKP